MKYFPWLIALSLGALTGFAYWHFIGCHSGSCPITSSPVNSTVYGAILGALLLNTIRGDQRKKQNGNGNA